MPGGILFLRDWEVISETARLAAERFPLWATYLEIGVNDGRTSRDLIEHVIQGRYVYYGIDPSEESEVVKRLERMRNYRYIRGLSHEVFPTVAADIRDTDGLSWLFVDGCHCAQCVARDAILYGSLLRPGGLLLFHDAASDTQGKDDQRYECLRGHHSEEEAAKGIQVRNFLDANLLAGFKLLKPAYDQDRGGVEVYERI